LALGALGWLDFRLNMFLNVMTPLIMVISFSDSMQLTFATRDRLLAGQNKRDALRNAILIVGPDKNAPMREPTKQAASPKSTTPVTLSLIICAKRSTRQSRRSASNRSSLLRRCPCRKLNPNILMV
jgi:hypothetical protein